MNTEQHYQSIILNERVNLADAIRRGLVWRAGFHGTNLARAGARLIELRESVMPDSDLSYIPWQEIAETWRDTALAWKRKHDALEQRVRDYASALSITTPNPTKAHALDELTYADGYAQAVEDHREPRVIREFGR